MTNEQYQEAVWRFWEVMNNDPQRLGEYKFSPGYTYNGAPTTAAQTATGMQAMLKGFKSYKFTKGDLFGEGKKVVLRWHLHSVLESGEKQEQNGINIITFDDNDQIVSNWQVGPVAAATATDSDHADSATAY